MTQQKELDSIENHELISEYQGHLPCFDRVEPVIYSSENADVYMFGKPKNWKDDFYNHTQVIELLMKNNISKIYFPNISSFTGEICDEDDFNQSFKIPKYGLEVFYHKKTEGLVIPKNSAAFLCTADCPVIICKDKVDDLLIVAHAGLGSVVDKTMILNGHRSRFYKSVVDSIIDYLDENDNETCDCEIIIAGGISHKSFIYSPQDPVFGESNKKLLEFIIYNYGENTVPLGIDHGAISIQNIIKQQLNGWGVNFRDIRVDGIDTFTDSRFWSHTEFVQKRCSVDGRNGVMVIHK